MEALKIINYILSFVFALCYAHQIFYVAVVLLDRRRKRMRTDGQTVSLHRYAVLISARNEETVIAQLIRSIRNQDYPAELVDIYVAADNCTDATASAAREAGATVWERFNSGKVGKGYALQFLLRHIKGEFPERPCDGYFIFDADNLLEENYITEMNKIFSAGHRVVTSCRNSKNYAGNWVSAGYSLWFLRESHYLNGARMRLGTSCAVSGTGFLVHHEMIDRNGGWKHFLLTEDIEFTVDSILHGERIAYCETAVLYDEQPVSFRQSCRQRMRWAKGYLQVFRNYGGQLLSHIFRRRSFAAFDMTMANMPAIFLAVVSLALHTAAFLIGYAVDLQGVVILLNSVAEALFGAYFMLFLMGALTVVTEWKQIHCAAHEKILYTFTFPIFMMSYVPISFAAIFSKAEWKPIHHTCAATLDDVRNK